MTNAIREELEAIARRWVELGWQQGDAEATKGLYAQDFVDFSSPVRERGTRDDNAQSIRDLYAAFPDFHTTIDDLIIDTEQSKVAVRWTATGTHRGPFLGVEPTGNRVTFRGIETLTIRHGLIVERAGEWNGIAILEQMGARW
ncbi:MAG TPA: ester cyclase [Thermomicrobiales bacterium]|nr:ester cyclase [Thermomicrobiales bacterium]